MSAWSQPYARGPSRRGLYRSLQRCARIEVLVNPLLMAQ